MPLRDTEGVTNLPEPLPGTKPQVPTGMGLLPGGKKGRGKPPKCPASTPEGWEKGTFRALGQEIKNFFKSLKC